MPVAGNSLQMALEELDDARIELWNLPLTVEPFGVAEQAILDAAQLEWWDRQQHRAMAGVRQVHHEFAVRSTY